MLDITDAEFKSIRDIMYRRTGVNLKDSKRPLVITRLRKRLQDLSLNTFQEYIAILSRPNSDELETFINAITTNETYFYRHIKQFDYLKDKILPALIEKKRALGKKEIKVWSAASSTGEEPYSIAILFKEFFKDKPNWKISLYASDVNSDVLSFARIGRYPERSFRELPDVLKKKYCVPVPQENTIRQQEYDLSPDIKKMVTFAQHNLLHPPKYTQCDIIFLRNVLIYFDNTIKQKVVSLIEQGLSSDGYLFISLSESLNDVSSGCNFMQTGIYKKK